MNSNFVGHGKGELISDRVYRVKSCCAKFTPNINAFDVFEFINIGGALKLENPSGTPSEGVLITMAIKDTSSRALTWGDQYKSIETLPTTTTANKFLTMQFMWRSYDQKWHLLSSAVEA